MTSSEAWYIVKQPDGHCQVVSSQDVANLAESEPEKNESTAELKQWGPFASQAEAIARRVGLIRAGKCQPV